jgi:hypothetical protein
VALRGQLRALLAVEVLEMVEAVVERAGQMRGGPARLAAADGAVVEDDDGASLLGEKVRGGETGDPRPTMQTSVVRSEASDGRPGTSAVPAQTDRVFPPSGSMSSS